ncbi:MAG TPA: DUF4157 domain-containing protein [Thermoanaerobaculia bacterium]|nr:DUF4157 domain-containing protein [Thermoanaerobaculia bacterium]
MSNAPARSGGKPLDAAARAFFEPRFGHDFSSVRVHSDAHATRSIDAAAFTSGDHIVFRDEASSRQRSLLAHELSHVVQQREGPVVPGISTRGDAGERGADRAAAAVLRGGYARVEGTAHAVQRGGWFDPIGEELRPIVESAKYLHEAKKLVDDPTLDDATREELRTLIAQAERQLASLQRGDEAEAGHGSSAAALGTVGFAGITRTAGTQLVTKPSPWTIGAGLLLLAVAVIATSSSGRSRKNVVIRDLANTLESLGHTLQRAVTRPKPVAPPVNEAPPETAKFPPGTTPKPAAPAPKPAPAPAPKPAPKTGTGPKLDPVAPPVAHPDPDVDEDRRKGCVGRPGAARGGHNCHNDFALHVTGTNRDWDVVSRTGERASFDGVDHLRTLYDVKTGYRLLLDHRPETLPIRQRMLGKLQDQSARQQRIAHACGYRLLWVFNDQEVQEFVDGFIEPETDFEDFPCEEES